VREDVLAFHERQKEKGAQLMPRDPFLPGDDGLRSSVDEFPGCAAASPEWKQMRSLVADLKA
jgi:hypothetical protein